ncbi:MAG: hypothetical protein ABI488_25940 [Polyangiaceae bacterium]
MRPHTLASCAIAQPAYLDLAALGDFPTSNQTSESLSLAASDARLEFPAATLALDATARSDSAEQPFIGYGERIATALDFVLWPRGSACELERPSGTDSYPGKLGGEAMGYASSAGLVMIAGSNDGMSSAIVGALTFDARSGESHLVDPKLRAVLTEPRAFASVTDFGGKVLVAGGENPIHDPQIPATVLRETAEVYDPAQEFQSFEPALLKLAVPRTRHAAVTLVSGETVLIGGRAEDSEASSFVEVISPDTRVSKLIQNLRFGRNAPHALTLSDGRILIGDGEDAEGHPVGALEWRAADANSLEAPWDGSVALPARFDRAWVALPGGAALAVGGCEDRRPDAGEDCSEWCTRGCPPAPAPTTKQRYDAFWVAADGAVFTLDFPFSAAQPTLLPGSDGRPWLVTSGVNADGHAARGSFVAYRFDPWQKAFVETDLDLGTPTSDIPPRFVSTGADAFVWFEQDANGPVLQGARWGTRSTFVSDVELVTLRDAEDARRPAHLTPDHPPNSDVQYDSAHGVLAFTKARASAPNQCVWISDAQYADFSARIDFSSATAPTLKLGAMPIENAASTDTGACRLPNTGTAAGASLELVRTGTQLSVKMGTESARCSVLGERLPLGVCGSQLGAVAVTRLSVTRSN